MDAAEDEKDDQLQRQSADLVADLERSLRPFLWKRVQGEQCRGIRRKVTVRETDRLVALLEPFQEQPQLLDPHLKSLVPILADALLAYLNVVHPSSLPTKDYSSHAKLLMPVSRAICKILYTFCKIRGEKVIVRFFSTETRYLELLLSAIETGAAVKNQDDSERASAQEDGVIWDWEERYITLLWLSQLLLAPFDLATISSEESRSMAPPMIANLEWPSNVPALTLRVVPLAMRYLSSSGKESASAKVLLVRIAMRRDMQDLGVFRALVQWALRSLSRISATAASHTSIFHYTSLLSFVGGLLVSSVGTTNMQAYLVRITEMVDSIFATEDMDSYSHTIQQSPVARKAMVKILRQASVLALQDGEGAETEEIIQNSVGILLEMLSDTATNVRLAASKALSIIAVKLDADQASDVVDAVLSGLEKNALSLSNTDDEAKDLSRVDRNEWHGLIMTISHLLYRQAISAQDLPRIIEALRRGLNFEQRSPNGTSVGINVRDAANYGIWSLARRYTTKALQGMANRSFGFRWDDLDIPEASILQSLASELVIAASLDPAGNVRRGSSAALQELIGRHPNIVENGIAVVQVVDYHAVALRSRAIQEVAPHAAILSNFYRIGLLSGLMGWRGVKDGDATARRNAALALARILQTNDSQLTYNFGLVKDNFDRLPSREIENRHGIVLALAGILRLFAERSVDDCLDSPLGHNVMIFTQVPSVLHSLEIIPPGRSPELLAEAVGAFLQYGLSSSHDAGPALLESATALVLRFLKGDYPASIDSVSLGSANFLHKYGNACKRVIDEVKKQACQEGARKGATSIHILFHLLNSGTEIDGLSRDQILKIITKRWTARALPDLQIREVILECVTLCTLSHMEKQPLVTLIAEGLSDYTTTPQGDIGSKVRRAAAKAAASFMIIATPDRAREEILDGEKELFALIVRSAAEKLDKVRVEGKNALLCTLKEHLQHNHLHGDQKFVEILEALPSSSQDWFYFLLGIQLTKWWRTTASTAANNWSLELMAGYVTSAGGGSEDVVKASRAALVEFCTSDSVDNAEVTRNTNLVCSTLMALVKQKVEMAEDRVLVPALEVMAFLMDMHVFQTSNIDFKALHSLLRKTQLNSPNIRKLDACTKLYGALSSVPSIGTQASKSLARMLVHRYPNVRSVAVEELWVCLDGLERGEDDLDKRKEGLKGFDWVREGKERLGMRVGFFRL